MAKNIFRSDFDIHNDTVVIVGSGPNGNTNFHKIPDDAYVIACNLAIANPIIKPNAWCVVDPKCFDKHWFIEAQKTFVGDRIFRNNFPEDYLNHPNTYTVDRENGLSRKTDKFYPEYGEIKAGGTVCATALQIAYWFGCHGVSHYKDIMDKPTAEWSFKLGSPAIRLIGVDMNGKGYFDGSKGNMPTFKDGRWSVSADIIDAVVQWMIAKGCDIKSYSPTEIKVEVV